MVICINLVYKCLIVDEISVTKCDNIHNYMLIYLMLYG